MREDERLHHMSSGYYKKTRGKMINTKHGNSQKNPQLWCNRKGSQCISLRAIQTKMIGDTKYCLILVSKNIFSAALPFYPSHVFMANKHENYCAAKQLQKGVCVHERFLKRCFFIIIIG